MDLSKCCELSAHESEPKKPKDGKFQEIHKCRKCHKQIRITLKGNAVLGGEILVGVIYAEYA